MCSGLPPLCGELHKNGGLRIGGEHFHPFSPPTIIQVAVQPTWLLQHQRVRRSTWRILTSAGLALRGVAVTTVAMEQMQDGAS